MRHCKKMVPEVRSVNIQQKNDAPMVKRETQAMEKGEADSKFESVTWKVVSGKGNIDICI